MVTVRELIYMGIAIFGLGFILQPCMRTAYHRIHHTITLPGDLHD